MTTESNKEKNIRITTEKRNNYKNDDEKEKESNAWMISHSVPAGVCFIVGFVRLRHWVFIRFSSTDTFTGWLLFLMPTEVKFDCNSEFLFF